MLQAPFSFRGRIRRTEYGITVIMCICIHSFISGLVKSHQATELIEFAYFPMWWFLLAQGAKREHDLGYSGWWQLFPFRFVWLIVLKGDIGVNPYGSYPQKAE